MTNKKLCLGDGEISKLDNIKNEIKQIIYEYI